MNQSFTQKDVGSGNTALHYETRTDVLPFKLVSVHFLKLQLCSSAVSVGKTLLDCLKLDFYKIGLLRTLNKLMWIAPEAKSV